MVYTCARDYVEAGAAVFGESLRSGTPIAALAWRTGTCAEIALCPDTGLVAQVAPGEDDQTAVAALVEAVTAASKLTPRIVQEIGLERFDPQKHFEALASRPC